MSNKLTEVIYQKLPLPVDQFMSIVLNHTQHGYYTRNASIGYEGDFITAPEISQIFGEIVGAWVVHQLEKLIFTNPQLQEIALIELGPGRGVLLEDILRTVSKLRPNLMPYLKLQLVEINPRFINLQKAVAARYNLQAEWYNHVGNLPEGPAIIIANEFFDALPVKQYIWQDKQWYERVITAEGSDTLGFAFSSIPPYIASSLNKKYPNPAPHDIIEISIMREEIFKLLVSQIAQYGGALWLCDYGEVLPHPRSTLRSYYKHEIINIFEKLGEADLTTDVDFGTLIELTSLYSKLKYNILSQAEWLTMHGLEDRVKKLLPSEEKLSPLYTKLVSPSEMGAKFKILTVSL